MRRFYLIVNLIFLVLGYACNREDCGFHPEFDCYVLLPSEGLGDKAFVDAIYEGVEQTLKNQPVRLNYVIPETFEDAVNWIQNMGSLGESDGHPGLIIIGGNQFVEAVDQLEGNFGIHAVLVLGGQCQPQQGLVSVDYCMFGASYLGTYLSAQQFQSCRARFVAGFDARFMEESKAGFEAGLKDAKGTLLDPVFLSSDFTGFTLSDSAYSKTTDLLTDTDLIMAFADGSNRGIINAAMDFPEKRLVVAMDGNQNWMGTSVVSGSVVKHFYLDIDEFVSQFSQNRYLSGHYFRTLSSGYVCFDNNTSIIPDYLMTDSLMQRAISLEQQFLADH